MAWYGPPERAAVPYQEPYGKDVWPSAYWVTDAETADPSSASDRVSSNNRAYDVLSEHRDECFVDATCCIYDGTMVAGLYESFLDSPEPALLPDHELDLPGSSTVLFPRVLCTRQTRFVSYSGRGVCEVWRWVHESIDRAG